MSTNIKSFGVLVGDSPNQLNYGPETIISMSTTSKLMSDSSSNGIPSIGNCYSATIDLVLKRTKDTIPRMAKLVPYVIFNDGTQLNMGAYFIDTRELSSAEETVYATDTLTINGYDSMLKTQQSYYIAQEDEIYDWQANETYYVDEVVKYNSTYYRCIKTHDAGDTFESKYWEVTEVGDQGTWPQADTVALAYIANKIGVSIEPTSLALINQAYDIEYPGYGDSAYTFRDVLGYIGSMYAGNWIINRSGNLELVQLNSLSDPITINAFSDCTSQQANDPYTRVTIDLGSDYYYTDGDDTGTELLVDCPWGTEEMATRILSKVKNYIYKPFEVSSCLYDTDIKLGSTVKIGDTVSQVFSLQIDFDYMMTADISAPTDSEIDHEYEYKQTSTEDLKHDVRNIKTSLVVQQGKIMGYISGDLKVYRGGSAPKATYEYKAGDMWYCDDDSGAYELDTWYRYNGESWEKADNADIPVAPDWEEDKSYSKNEVVTGPDGKWYSSKKDNNEGNEPPNTEWWTECETITATSESKILQQLDSIQLSVTQGENGSEIKLTSNGITAKTTGQMLFKTDSAHFEGTLSASQVIAIGDGFAVQDSGGTTYGYVGFGTGQSSSGETYGAVLQAAVATDADAWAANTAYSVGDIVTRQNTNYYKCITAHTSGEEFDTQYWESTSGKYDVDPKHYVIATNSGVRMQSGDHSLYVTDSGCYADGVLIGTAVFG